MWININVDRCIIRYLSKWLFIKLKMSSWNKYVKEVLVLSQNTNSKEHQKTAACFYINCLCPYSRAYTQICCLFFFFILFSFHFILFFWGKWKWWVFLFFSSSTSIYEWWWVNHFVCYSVCKFRIFYCFVLPDDSIK